MHHLCLVSNTIIALGADTPINSFQLMAVVHVHCTYYFCILQPCQENLFTTLVKEFRSVFPQVIMEMVGENDKVVEADDLLAVLHKDAGLFHYLLKFVCLKTDLIKHVTALAEVYGKCAKSI